MKLFGEQLAKHSSAVFLTAKQDLSKGYVGPLDSISMSMNGHLKWFVEAPRTTPDDIHSRRLIAAEFHKHMASSAAGRVAEFGDLLVASLCGLLNTSLRHRLTFNVKLCSHCIVTPVHASTLAFVMSEILLNSLKHARPDGGRIVVGIECLPGPDGRTVLAICDDGMGLPADFAEWLDAGDGIMRVRFTLEKMGASLNLESDNLGLRFQIVLQASAARGVLKSAVPRVLSAYSASYLKEGHNQHAYTPD